MAERDPSQRDAEHSQTMAVGLGLALGSGAGVAIGSGIGVMTGDMGLWIALGVPMGSGLGLALGLIWWAVNQPAPPGTCPHCGYDTRGLKGTICPECGNDITKPPPDPLTGA